MFQNKHCRSKGENTMKVTLKDGSVKEYSEPILHLTLQEV